MTRLALAAVLAAAVAAPVAAAAQDWTAPRAADAATRAWERSGDLGTSGWEAQAKAARRTQKAREDEWDRKTGRATRSICTGAKGC
jgi:opacity protein-like surface antigen